MITDHRFIANFKKYQFLLDQLVKRDIKIKYRRSVLGIFWSFLEPLLSMIVLTIIFSTIFAKFGVENFPVYLLTGQLIFTFFAGGSRGAMRSIKSNAGIMKTIYVPKYIYSLATIISNFVTFALSLIVLFLVMLATNSPFTIYIILTIIPILVLVILTIGAGLILASLNVFFRDIEHLYGVFLTLLMYATPIFYPANIVPESWRWIQTANPLFGIIECCRSVFLYGTIYDPFILLPSAITAVFLLITGLVVFYKLQDKFILYI